MNIKVNGKCRYISQEKKVTGTKEPHTFKILVLETIENSYIAVHVWNDKLHQIELYKVGDILELDCRVESHKNRKNPDLWYHKILLV